MQQKVLDNRLNETELRISLNVSLTYVIMCVTGISATVCAFQYLISKNIIQKPSLNIENKISEDRKNVKAKEIKSAKQTVNSSSSSVRLINDIEKYRNEY